MEDTQIVELFWKRDEGAIRAVDSKYRNFCYKIAWNMLGGREDSEECVNDTWLAAWTYIPPKRPDRLPPFLGKITRGLAVDCLRKKYAGKSPYMHMADIGGEIEKLDHAVDVIGAHMEMRELTEIINTFLAELNAADRDMMIQRYWLMEPVKNIAVRHGVSQGAVKQHLFRTRKKLQKRLEKEGHL